ncbi:MAG: SCO family protein, partial [Pseudomonadota bacterium]
ADLRARFQVNLEEVAEDPTGAPIYAHGSFIYVIGRDGKVATMLPPILGPERIAEVAMGYF